MKAVILCGGSGTRLWPLSTSTKPKQFLPLVHQCHSMFQQTLLLAESSEATEIMVVVNERFVDLVEAQVEEMRLRIPHRIIVEPFQRNTCPAITAATLCSGHPDTVLVVLPCDHIWDTDTFKDTITKAVEMSRDEECIVTLGIQPAYPETGYGYIEVGNNCCVQQFREKPDLATASEYIRSGRYLWNSGVFIFRTSTMLKELQLLRPSLLELVSQSLATNIFSDIILLDKEKFTQTENISIDYAIMEHTSLAKVVAYKGFWSDVGSFKSLKDVISPKDEHKNHFRGDVREHNVHDSMVIVPDESGVGVTVIGIKNCVVVVSEDGKRVLVTTEEECQAVKKFASAS